MLLDVIVVIDCAVTIAPHQSVKRIRNVKAEARPCTEAGRRQI
jgi:hypothetical protein